MSLGTDVGDSDVAETRWHLKALETLLDRRIFVRVPGVMGQDRAVFHHESLDLSPSRRRVVTAP